MAEERERPRPHGDPLRDEIGTEGNAAQRQSDAPGDATASIGSDRVGQETDRDEGRGSTANGVPAFDEDSGDERRRLYDAGADIVSRSD